MMIDRRGVLGGTAATLAIAVNPLASAEVAASADLASALEAILSGRSPEEGGIRIDAPAVAENGAQVPVTIYVESPMTPEDHVTAIHLVATANPTPGIGTFRLMPHLARAEVFTRIRLAEAQEIIVLAETSSGRVKRATARIAVTVGGCAT